MEGKSPSLRKRNTCPEFPSPGEGIADGIAHEHRTLGAKKSQKTAHGRKAPSRRSDLQKKTHSKPVEALAALKKGALPQTDVEAPQSAQLPPSSQQARPPATASPGVKPRCRSASMQLLSPEKQPLDRKRATTEAIGGITLDFIVDEAETQPMAQAHAQREDASLESPASETTDGCREDRPLVSPASGPADEACSQQPLPADVDAEQAPATDPAAKKAVLRALTDAALAASPREAAATPPSRDGPGRGSKATQVSTPRKTFGKVQSDNRQALDLFARAGVEAVPKNGVTLGPNLRTALNKQTFMDTRWENSQKFIQSRLLSQGADDRCVTRELLMQGAKAFGIWSVVDASLDAVMRQVLQDGKLNLVSAPIAEIIDSAVTASQQVAPARDAPQTHLSARALVRRLTVNLDPTQPSNARSCLLRCLPQRWHQHLEPGEAAMAKVIIVLVVTGISLYSAVTLCFKTYPESLEYFGIPFFFARGTGMMCALLTGIIYATMARTAGKAIFKCMNPGSIMATFFDAHKDLHVFCGKMLFVASVVHTIAHLIGTAKGVEQHSADELNQILGCARPNETPGYLGAKFPMFEWPKCPFERNYTVMDVVFFSTPGVTGILLLVLISAGLWTALDDQRRANFDRFMGIHQIMLWSWPLLNFIHGSNGWMGTGFPLIAFTTSLFFALYLIDRIGRVLRYYLFVGGAVKIVESTVREGKKGGADGALVYLRISRPPYLWRFWSGTYAFICMPDVAVTQWHPFTICSGNDDEYVEFLIQAVGDWTTSLAQACLDVASAQGAKQFPRVALDGPYPAPTQSALYRPVIVAVGAGVGITPFLSLMSSIITEMLAHDRSLMRLSRDNRHDNPDAPLPSTVLRLREAHFYWMSRSADEFLFGRKLFESIVNHSSLRDRIFLHLHVTQKEPEKDAPSYIFREGIRRQSKVDRDAFMALWDKQQTASIFSGPSVPWGWVLGAKYDVLWVSHLVPSGSDAEESDTIWRDRMESDSSWSHSWLDIGRSRIGSGRSRLGSEQSAESMMTALPSKILLPVNFGRPDFATEIRAIGKANPDFNLHVYVCGNNMVVKSLQDVCEACNEHSKACTTEWAPNRYQKYFVHHERFG